MIEIECVGQPRDQFGESPLWCPAEQALYWVDVTAPAIRRLHPASGETMSWPVAEHVGSIGLRSAGGLIAAMRSGIYAIDLATGHRDLIAARPGGDRRLRFNDGKCDRAGRFWSGTLDDQDFSPVGELFCLGVDRSLRKADTGFILVNGIAWSPDDRLMYVADSRRETVYAYDFDMGSGLIANRRPFISTEDVAGRVDGATVDRDGHYWCAHVRGGQVAQYDRSGRLMRAISLPTKYPLMCTFGGESLDVLYVTTSRALLRPEEVAEQPLAGAVFAIHGTGSRGIPEPCYAG